MTLPTEVREMLRKRYGDACMYNGGMRYFARQMGSAAPEVCIEDAMLRMHAITYKSMCLYARSRRAKMADLGCFGAVSAETGEFEVAPDTASALAADRIPIESTEPLWFDVFLWLMASVQRFYMVHEQSSVYVMLFDRGTPPAKYLKHIERYGGRAKNIPPQYILADGGCGGGGGGGQSAEELIASSPYMPPHVKYYFQQKGFVDALIRHVACVLIPRYYRPPPERTFILDGPARNETPLAWVNGGARGELTAPMYKNNCLESDLSIVFWCNVFKSRDLHVVTADGDVLLALLLHTRYRIARMAASASAPGRSVDFGFLNSIYLEHASATFDEREHELVSDAYAATCAEHRYNELNGGASSVAKARYLARLDVRRRAQNEELSAMMLDDDDDSNATPSAAAAAAAASGHNCEGAPSGTDVAGAGGAAGARRPTVNDSVDGGAAASSHGRGGRVRRMLDLRDDDDDDDNGRCGGGGAKAEGSTRPRKGAPAVLPLSAWQRERADAERQECDAAYAQLLAAAAAQDAIGAGGEFGQDAALARPGVTAAAAAAAAEAPSKRKKAATTAEQGTSALKRAASLSNAEMEARYDVYYTSEGEKKYRWYEVVNVNLLYQCAHDELMCAYDRRMVPAVGDSFLPIESLVLACKLCGDDYVCKPRGIGATYLLRSFYERLNDNGVLVYGRRVDTTRYANYAPDALAAPGKRDVIKLQHSGDAAAVAAATNDAGGSRSSGGGGGGGDAELPMPGAQSAATAAARIDQRLCDDIASDYAQYLQLTIDYRAVAKLIRNAFVLKGAKKVPARSDDETWVVCANARYSLNYFANDFKVGTTFTDCFDVHAGPGGCGRSVYGYELPDPTAYPSQTNIRRPERICDCFVDSIVEYIAESNRRAVGEARHA